MLATLTAWLQSGTPPHYVWCLLALYLVGNELLRKVPAVRANSWVEAIFNLANKLLLPVFGRFPVLGPFLALLDTPDPNAGAIVVKTPPGGTGLLTALLPVLFLLSSCAYCLQPAHQSEAKCKTAAIAIDCSPPIIVSTVEAILSDVIVAISGGAVDWMALAQLEEKNGIAAVACAIQKADSFALNPGPSVHAHAKEYFARKHVAPRSH